MALGFAGMWTLVVILAPQMAEAQEAADFFSAELLQLSYRRRRASGRA